MGPILVYKDYRVQRKTMVMWNFREDAGCQVPCKAMRGVPQIDLSLTTVISIYAPDLYYAHLYYCKQGSYIVI